MTTTFHLEVGPDRLATLTFDAPGKRVNVFSPEVLFELRDLVAELAKRRDIGVLVLLSGKDSNFIAGADVDMIADVTDPAVAEEGARLGQQLFSAWNQLPFPTVAALRGTTMGGGTEIALASTWRVASDRDAVQIGLPEVKLGIVPGWGGCTRLPRVVGLAAALDMILTGKTVRAKQAFKMGLVDALVPDAQFLPLVRQFALERIDKKGRPARRTTLKDKLLEGNPLGRILVFSQAKKATLAASKGHYPAPLRAIEVVKAGTGSLSRGLAAEAKAIGELATSPIAKNLIHVFRLMEDNKRSPGLPGGEAVPVEAAVVLGAGVMGGGIGHLLVDKGDIATRLKDIAPAALASGMAHAAELFEKQVRRRRMRPDERKRKLALLSPTLDDRGFGRADLVIEAVVEKLEVKQKVFADTAAKVRANTVLASNTSSLSIDAIGRDTPHPERVVGMHFFNPVDKMPLVDVIAGAKSAPWAVNTVFELTRRVGKTPVIVKDAPGFLVNRLLMFSLSESLWLLDEGVPPEAIDRAMKRWGMPMGPLELTEEVGIDVANKVAHILHDAFGDRL
ncbi:MAG: 3-hydroxyacyl-CoA dehydrogenase NAD-binding domain-containing protein, partial [Thermoanaerobaculia bacterium]|nr:3-hydroxyacyl-CoA dehydrogenase NAD-binding domain-containing protein [Thermoanaerobaculia bacterium]